MRLTGKNNVLAENNTGFYKTLCYSKCCSQTAFVRKHYLKQKVFSFRDKFTVKDEYGTDKYFVKGVIFSWGKRLHIYDSAQNEITHIKQRIISFLPKYEVYIGGNYFATIAKELSFFRPKLRIEECNLNITGDFLNHNFKIERQGRQVASISKKWFTFGDSYEIDILYANDEITILALVLAIDCIASVQSVNAN